MLLDKQGALYQQVARALKLAIQEGRLAAGRKMPSTRSLAKALRVSRKSIVQAYDLLCAEQLAVARVGSGTRVAKMNDAAAKFNSPLIQQPTSQYVARMRELGPLTLGTDANYRYDLQYGVPLLTAPFLSSWGRRLAAAAIRVGPKYPTVGGFAPLRHALADYLARRRAVICDPANILIVGGMQQAVALVCRVLLDVRDSVVVEDPHYRLAVDALKAHGARTLSVRTDSEGLVVRELPKSPVRLVFVTPAHQFPSGTIMSISRRMELLRWANANACWVFEDDYDCEFHAGARPIAALRSLDLADRVIHVGTFSKTLFPSLRLGYIVCPEALKSDFFSAKLLDDLGSPTIEQAALATFIQSGQYDSYLRNSRKEVLERRRAVIDALRRLVGDHIEIGPHEGGTHFVLWLRELSFVQLRSLIENAALAGLRLHPVHTYYRRKLPQPGLLVGYAGMPPYQLRAAVEVFARCLKATKAA
ncbi:MAG TPA: PLP-dependent aminotransferase family protein [Steroidobacteraceae bacterium]